MNQSAISMLQKSIELMDKDTCTDLMPEMIPPLLSVSRRALSFGRCRLVLINIKLTFF